MINGHRIIPSTWAGYLALGLGLGSPGVLAALRNNHRMVFRVDVELKELYDPFGRW